MCRSPVKDGGLDKGRIGLPTVVTGFRLGIPGSLCEVSRSRGKKYTLLFQDLFHFTGRVSVAVQLLSDPDLNPVTWDHLSLVD